LQSVNKSEQNLGRGIARFRNVRKSGNATFNFGCGGIFQVVMGSLILFALFKIIYGGDGYSQRSATPPSILLGGGISQVVMGSLLFPLFKIIYGGDGYSQSESSVFPDE
jgi:hypothetical protein